MEVVKKYKGKILLFGEYSVIHGSDALAMPTDLFSGFWDFDEALSKEQKILYAFHAYLSGLDFENAIYQKEAFQKGLDQALFFNSSIPIGYGAGSSGAVCAAIFDQYFQKDNALSLLDLKHILAKMESFFHGSSSGLDPTISYLNQAIFIQSGLSQSVEIPKLQAPYHLFLLDTGFPRKTAPLVRLYLEKYQSDEKFQEAIVKQLSKFNNLAIQHFLKSDSESLLDTFHKISVFQWQYFQEMIPEQICDIWQDGLKSELFKLKLCGAGGGGFLLGMTKDWEATLIKLKDKRVIKLPLL